MAKTATSASKKPPISTADIQRGRQHKPDRILVYGVEKIGKSSFGAGAPNPVFIAAEAGIGHLDVASFPQPKTFLEVLECIRALGQDPGEFETLVIDPIGWVDHLIRDHVCREQKWNTEDFSKYGRGIKVALDEHRKLLSYLDRLRAVQGFEIIIIAHADVKDFKNPQGEDYMRYRPDIDGEKAPELYKQWADSILFLNFETFVKTGEGFAKNKGNSTGNRIMHTMREAALDAGSRWGIPAEIEIPEGDPTQSYRSYAHYRAEGGRYIAKKGAA